MVGTLRCDADELAACVSCGLCLAHCPTYRVTGEEGLSPRGRIAAIRAVDAGAAVDSAFVHMMETCVQCRACETACPSSVPFGHLMEAAREAIAADTVPRWSRLGYQVLGRPRLLRSLTTLGAVFQRAGLVPPAVRRRLNLPVLPVRQHPLVATGDDVWLFTGCVTDAWLRPVHEAAIAVLGAMGAGVALPGPGAGCCGALSAHAGLMDQTLDMGRRVMGAFPGDHPILVDSAGCGAILKEYGRLFDSEAARRFSARVQDIHEWMAAHADALPPAVDGRRAPRIAIQDPCHLRHVQRVERHVRTVLDPYGRLVELTDEGRCCGAGGSYSVLQPALATAIRDQKVAVIAAADADVVASANPGCSMWLAAAGVPVKHPVQIIAESAGLASAGAG